MFSESLFFYVLFPSCRAAACRRLDDLEPPGDRNGGYSKFPVRPKTKQRRGLVWTVGCDIPQPVIEQGNRYHRVVLFIQNASKMEGQQNVKTRFTKQLTIAMPPEHFRQIKRITDQEEISIAEFCREIIAEALKNIPNDRQDI